VDSSDQDFRILATTAVAASPVPASYALHAPAPSPFRATTSLRFDLPHTARVWLEILDVNGRRVRALLSGDPLEAGRRERTWDGCDGRGRPVPSGVYLARMRAPGFTAVRKLQVLR
jgi:hypothetical protein